MEDSLWLEKGKMPRGWWWDAECVKTRSEARQAETTYRKGHAKLLNHLKQGIGPPLSVEEAQARIDADNQRKQTMLTRVRALREVMRKKERQCRLRRRKAMLENRFSRRF